MWFYGCLFGACSSSLLSVLVPPGLRLAIAFAVPGRRSNETKMQHLKLIVGLAACRKLNYKLAPKTTELAVCKATRTN